MRLHIHHETRYRYAEPARNIKQALRMTPLDHDGQHVVRWLIEPGTEGQLTSTVDPFGNVVHMFSADEPVQEFRIVVDGDVETSDTAGIIRQAVEQVPDGCFLRGTHLTEADEAIRAFAEERRDGSGRVLATLHNLMEAVHDTMAFEAGRTAVGTGAGEAFRLKRGVCQDMAHVFLAAARHLEIPSRYVSGYVLAPEDAEGDQASHAWVEAKVPDLGWVGFDPTHLTCPTPDYVRVAIGLDYGDAAPVRGSRRGGGVETMTVDLRVEPAGPGRRQTRRQGQSQDQRPE